MANLTITLKSQPVRVFGPSPPSLLGPTLILGIDPWGMKIAGQTHTPRMILDYGKNWTGSNQITVSYANSDKEEYDGRGYNYVFIDRVTNAESMSVNAYTSQSVGSLTYTSLSAGSTNWS